MTERETAIMSEAFTIGRVYAMTGEKESPSEIHAKLLSKCFAAAIHADMQEINKLRRKPAMNAINKLLDTVDWAPIKYEGGEPKEDLPFVTHEGVLKILNIEIKVCQLSNGMRVIPEGELERLFRA